MKLGFFPTGKMRELDLEGMIRWGAEHGYQAFDVPPDVDGTRAICDRYGLQVSSTSGLYGNPITADDAERELLQWKKVRFMADKVNGAYTVIHFEAAN